MASVQADTLSTEAPQPPSLVLHSLLKYCGKLDASHLRRAIKSSPCSICTNPIGKQGPISVTPCTHYFHAECLNGWAKMNKVSCPVCRKEYGPPPQTESEQSLPHDMQTLLEQIGASQRASPSFARVLSTYNPTTTHLETQLNLNNDNQVLIDLMTVGDTLVNDLFNNAQIFSMRF